MTLLRLVLCQMPNVKHLSLGEINFVEGSWESFFEALAYSKQLSSLKIESEGYLDYHDGREFIYHESRRGVTLSERIEDYVVYGGPYPCPQNGQPDSAVSKCLDESGPELSQRVMNLRQRNSSPSHSRQSRLKLCTKE